MQWHWCDVANGYTSIIWPIGSGVVVSDGVMKVVRGDKVGKILEFDVADALANCSPADDIQSVKSDHPLANSVATSVQFSTNVCLNKVESCQIRLMLTWEIPALATEDCDQVKYPQLSISQGELESCTSRGRGGLVNLRSPV